MWLGRPGGDFWFGPESFGLGLVETFGGVWVRRSPHCRGRRHSDQLDWTSRQWNVDALQPMENGRTLQEKLKLEPCRFLLFWSNDEVKGRFKDQRKVNSTLMKEIWGILNMTQLGKFSFKWHLFSHFTELCPGIHQCNVCHSNINWGQTSEADMVHLGANINLSCEKKLFSKDIKSSFWCRS